MTLAITYYVNALEFSFTLANVSEMIAISKLNIMIKLKTVAIKNNIHTNNK
jgi:hypothetical protein